MIGDGNNGSLQESTDTTFLVKESEEKSMKPTAPAETEIAKDKGWPPPPTRVYQPCSMAYSKDTLKHMKTNGQTGHTGYNLPRWSDELPPGFENTVCPCGQFLSIVTAVTYVVSFVMIFYLVLDQRWEKVSLPHHDCLSEGILLLIQSFVSVIFTCTVAITVVPGRVPIPRNVYILITASLMLTFLGEGIWITRELLHGHASYSKTWNETLAFQSEALQEFSNNPINNIPRWMNEIQLSHKCCGALGPKDWLSDFNEFDVPDSCCVTPMEGCGIGYFRPPEKLLIPSIPMFTEGCASSQSRLSKLTYKNVLAIHYIKVFQAFFTLILFIILNVCCGVASPPPHPRSFRHLA